MQIMSLKFQKKLSIFVKGQFESIFAKIHLEGNKYVICGSIYRPNTGPNASIKACSEHIDTIVTAIKKDANLNKAADIILAGDFNINLLKYGQAQDVSDFTETLLALGQLPLTTIPTRITDYNATILDLICSSNTGSQYETGVLVTSIADHLATYYIKNYN